MFFRKSKRIKELEREVSRLKAQTISEYYKGFANGQKEILNKLLTGTPNEIRKRFDLPPIHDGKRANVLIVDDTLKTEKVSVTIECEKTMSPDRVKRIIAKELANRLMDHIDLEHYDYVTRPYRATLGTIMIVRSEKNCNT